MRRINEIFHSLQGEGARTGSPSVFVRFSGCNKECWFCDTAHHEGEMLDDEETVRRINALPGGWIVLTGGEPGLWIDNGFIEMLHDRTGRKIAIETNGSVALPEGIDWVTVSPKCGVEGAGDYAVLARHADEVKVVDTGQDLELYFSLPCVTDSTRFYLQPCHVDDAVQNKANMERTVGRVLADPRWTLSVQLHRWLGIR